MDELLKARENTAKYMKDLRDLQLTLHEALVELSDATERNLRLVDEITNYETIYNKRVEPKGGKK
jgi:hypothetical protein